MSREEKDIYDLEEDYFQEEEEMDELEDSEEFEDHIIYHNFYGY